MRGEEVRKERWNNKGQKVNRAEGRGESGLQETSKSFCRVKLLETEEEKKKVQPSFVLICSETAGGLDISFTSHRDSTHSSTPTGGLKVLLPSSGESEMRMVPNGFSMQRADVLTYGPLRLLLTAPHSKHLQHPVNQANLLLFLLFSLEWEA